MRTTGTSGGDGCCWHLRCRHRSSVFRANVRSASASGLWRRRPKPRGCQRWWRWWRCQSSRGCRWRKRRGQHQSFWEQMDQSGRRLESQQRRSGYGLLEHRSRWHASQHRRWRLGSIELHLVHGRHLWFCPWGVGQQAMVQSGSSNLRQLGESLGSELHLRTDRRRCGLWCSLARCDRRAW